VLRKDIRSTDGVIGLTRRTVRRFAAWTDNASMIQV
jgi:hypothetical protein